MCAAQRTRGHLPQPWEEVKVCGKSRQRTVAAAGQVMRVTQSLAQSGMTVCATIHCPPPHTFALFDRLLVLQRGRIVYFGGNGLAAAAYFLGLPAKARHSRKLALVVCVQHSRRDRRSASAPGSASRHHALSRERRLHLFTF